MKPGIRIYPTGEFEQPIVYNIPQRVPIATACRLFDCSRQYFYHLQSKGYKVLKGIKGEKRRGKTFVDVPAFYEAMEDI